LVNPIAVRFCKAVSATKSSGLSSANIISAANPADDESPVNDVTTPGTLLNIEKAVDIPAKTRKHSISTE
jgi:hypothetical protein